MEITKTLTINSSHVSADTAVKLHNESLTPHDKPREWTCIDIYKKHRSSVGDVESEYFIHIDRQKFRDHLVHYHDIPQDLVDVICLALDVGCDVLHLSPYGEELMSLQRYYSHKRYSDGIMSITETVWNTQGKVSECKIAIERDKL